MRNYARLWKSAKLCTIMHVHTPPPCFEPVFQASPPLIHTGSKGPPSAGVAMDHGPLLTLCSNGQEAWWRPLVNVCGFCGSRDECTIRLQTQPPPPPPPAVKVAPKREGVGVWPIVPTPPGESVDSLYPRPRGPPAALAGLSNPVFLQSVLPTLAAGDAEVSGDPGDPEVSGSWMLHKCLGKVVTQQTQNQNYLGPSVTPTSPHQEPARQTTCNPPPVRGKNFPLYGPLCGADLFW